MKNKLILFILVFLISLTSVLALPTIIDKTDLSNLSSEREYRSWDWTNITLLWMPDMNVTTIGFNWSCSYAGESTIPSCFAQTGTPSISTNNTFGSLPNKIRIDGGGTTAITYTSLSSKMYYMGFREQTGGANVWMELDNSDPCVGNRLGIAKEAVNNRGSSGGACGSQGTFLASINSSEYIVTSADARTGIAYASNGTEIDTWTASQSITYNKFLFLQTGGVGALGYIRIYDQDIAVQNSSANRWQKKIMLSAPNATFNLSILKMNANNSDFGANNFTLFISCNNGTNYSTTKMNSTVLDCGQLSQDIIYGYNTSLRTNITSVYLFSAFILKTLSTISISAKNIFDNTTILSFNINITNSTYSVNYSTTTGSIGIDNITDGLYNFTFSSDENGGYFNRTYNDWDVTANKKLIGELYQTIAYISANMRGSNISIFPFNASLTNGMATNQSNSSGGLRLYLNSSVNLINGYSSGYFDIMRNFTLANKSINYLSMNFPNINSSISAYSSINGSFFSNFTVYISSNNYTFTENLTDKGTGNATFSLTNGTYILRIDIPSNNPLFTSITILDNSSFYNFSFAIGVLNSINFSIYDENTDTLLITNVTIQIIGDTFAQNYTTQNGKLFANGLPPQEYRIRHLASNYKERDQYYTLFNGTNISIDLFLLSNGNSTDTTFSILDENNRPVSNSTTKMLRYFPNRLGYTITAMSRTDSNGAMKINLEQFNAFYYFIIQKTNQTLLTTIPARIIVSALTYNVFLTENILKSRSLVQQISHSLTHDNETDIIRYIYNDPINILKQTCLIVSRIGANSKSDVCNICSTASAGTLLCTINSSTSSFNAYTILETNTANSPYRLDDISIISNFNKNVVRKIGKSGLFIASYFIMGMALLSMPIAWLSIMFTLIGLTFNLMVGLITFSYIGLMGIILIGVFIMWRMRSG